MINKFENRKTNRSSLTNTLRGITNEEKLNNLWLKMQITLNSIFDSSLDNRSGARVAKGIRQVCFSLFFLLLLEKKEGLFRMYMMGKPVNYAGRSVISSDPFIAIYQVGIPEIFTKKLTYPELVIRHNCYRHLRTGDYVLVNHQPTLHRPSSNGDGMKMNIHLSQNELTRAEPTELMINYQDFLIISTILLYIQPVNQASLYLDSKSKLSMKSCASKSNVTNIDLMADTDVIIRHGHLLSGLIDKAHCSSTLPSVVHCYYQLYGKRCAADLDLHLELNDVLLLSLGVSHRRRLINQCRAQAGFCSKSFDEHISKEMDINYKISIDQYQNQIVKQSMSNLFKQFQENNLQFLIQSGAKG
ncbi:unnamed protein product [Rotaria sordida]|uniref:DNA-directed RNA polymerase n=1 Tax=Rotaria sordida TaxID=392033 RepID=A0A816DU50_9BILA|nr:unnamed protein product [Rotaria sordida]